MNKQGLSTREMAIFSMLGGLMYLTKVIMEWIPNVHLLGVLIVVYTIVYEKKALIIIYVYVFMTGAMNGFTSWWYPYLYIWTPLWAMATLIPRSWSGKIRGPLYMLICGIHGLSFGILYAPVHALLYGFTIERTIAWVVAGFPFDIIHGISNFCSAIIILPLANVLARLDKINNIK